jgi:broad specificity phosphatase PhoE
VPTLIEPGFDEIRAGDLEGAPIEAYRSWQDQHTPGDRLPHGESIEEALWRYAGALRHLLDRTETVTLVVIHDLALRLSRRPPQPARRPRTARPFRTRFRFSSTSPQPGALRPA